VTFKNHPSRAPVVWRVQSNVSVAAGGRIDLTGQRSGVSVVTNLEAGPGGFRSAVQGGSSLGPGGAINTNATYRSSYGNPTLIPLIGGSGLNEGSQNSYAAGGGAILIAAANTITNNGTIQSKGANGLFFNASGGGIRLVSESLQGSGTVDAQPEGRLRIEANTVSGGITLLPSTAIAPPGATPTIWPPATAPVCAILSVGGVSVSSDPRADFGLMPDATIYASNPVEVLLQTQNFPTSGVVQVRVAPKTTTNTVWVTATCITGNVISATWRASMTLTNVMTLLQARASSQ
jgi:hypothetical protein